MSHSLSFSISRLSKSKEPGFRGCPELHPHCSCGRREVEEWLEAPAEKESIWGPLLPPPAPDLAPVAPTVPVPAAGELGEDLPPGGARAPGRGQEEPALWKMPFAFRLRNDRTVSRSPIALNIG